MDEKTTLIACGVFKREYERLPEDLRLLFEAHFLDSMLHMDPEKLDKAIAALLPAPPRKAVILYGDCAPHMRDFLDSGRVSRVSAVNCIEISIGTPKYRELRKRGSFFLMPEWTERWEEIFKRELGLTTEELARDFMSENATELVYVDSGGSKPPENTLRAAAGYVGLPYRIMQADGTALETALRRALAEVRDAD